jgi:hypothetical protein
MYRNHLFSLKEKHKLAEPVPEVFFQEAASWVIGLLQVRALTGLYNIYLQLHPILTKNK